jgi:hypothetical protein
MSTETSCLVWAKRVKSLIRRPLLPVYSVDGDFKGERLRILVADDGGTLGYIRMLAFPKESNIRRIGSISAFRASELAHRGDADLVVVGANHLLLSKYTASDFYFAPRFVRLSLYVYDTPDVMVDKLHGSAREDLKRNIRRMTERGYSYDVTTDQQWFDLFYYRMYKPYAESRHGDLARIHKYETIRKDFRRGAGISIKREGTPVAGAIAYTDGSTMYNPCKGILDGDPALCREGASVALYYYSLHLAHSSGCKIADFGYSPPFLSDGALSYKLKWGMDILNRDDSNGVYAIAAPGRTEQALRFLKANRFYCLTTRGIELCNEF